MTTIGVNKTNIIDREEVDISALINQLMVNKWLLLCVISAALSCGHWFFYRQTPIYQSDVLLQIDTNRGGFSQNSFAEQLAFGAGGGGGNTVVTQIALMQSSFILDPVITSLGLDTDIQVEKPPIWKRLFQRNVYKRMITITSFELPKDQRNKVFQLLVDKPNHLVLRDNEGHIVLQGSINEELMNEEKTITLKVASIQTSVGTRFLLTKHSKSMVMQSLSARLKIEEIGANTQHGTGILSMIFQGEDPLQVIQILNAIAKTAKAQDAKKKSQEASQTLDFLYKQLPITKTQLEKSEFSLNQYRAKSGKIDIKLQTQFLLNQLSDLDKKLGALNINKIDILQRYTPYHPIVIALDMKIKALTKQRQDLEKHLKNLPASDQIAVNLLRDVTVKKTLYMILLNKIQELQVIKAGTISSIRILTLAKMPDKPLAGNKRSIYILSLCIGAFVSAILIFGRQLLSPKINDPHWSERKYNIANLAIIPYCKEQSVAAIKLDSSKYIPLLACTNPKNLSIESLRSLRTTLQVSLLSAHNNIVSILGVAPGVGKSFVSANLAYLLASAGKRVLLIDADLRRGTLHKYFNLSSSPGLSDVLNGKTPIDEAVSASMHEKLKVLPRGAYPDDPAELLASVRFSTLINGLSEQFDVVIIDTAPVLLVTDAVLVGRLSSINYLVFGAGAHQPIDIDMTLKRLSGSNVSLQGAVFNFHRSQAKKMGYDHYYNYSYYYSEKKDHA